MRKSLAEAGDLAVAITRLRKCAQTLVKSAHAAEEFSKLAAMGMVAIVYDKTGVSLNREKG